jgi:hypothetical protein
LTDIYNSNARGEYQTISTGGKYVRKMGKEKEENLKEKEERRRMKGKWKSKGYDDCKKGKKI